MRCANWKGDRSAVEYGRLVCSSGGGSLSPQQSGGSAYEASHVEVQLDIVIFPTPHSLLNRDFIQGPPPFLGFDERVSSFHRCQLRLKMSGSYRFKMSDSAGGGGSQGSACAWCCACGHRQRGSRGRGAVASGSCCRGWRGFGSGVAPTRVAASRVPGMAAVPRLAKCSARRGRPPPQPSPRPTPGRDAWPRRPHGWHHPRDSAPAGSPRRYAPQPSHYDCPGTRPRSASDPPDSAGVSGARDQRGMAGG